MNSKAGRSARKAPSTIDQYILSFPSSTQKRLKQIRTAIKKVVPMAGEKISYGIPAFTLSGEYLIYFAGFTSHLSLFPAPRGIAEFKEELKGYKGGKGTMQIPLDEVIPFELIRRIVRYRIGEANYRLHSKLKGGKAVMHHHKDGSKWAKGNMKGKEMHGYWEWYRKDGTVMRSGYFSKGEQVGEWITYNGKGGIVKVTQMA